MPSPVRKPISPTKIAHQTALSPNPQDLANQLAQELENLPPAAFILTTNNNPLSLPISCSQILCQEKLLGPTGKISFHNLPQLKNNQFLQKLKAKLTYTLLQTQFRQELFQLSQTAALLANLSQYYSSHFNAFSYLWSNHYSTPITSVYLTQLYPHLLSSRLKLHRHSKKTALKKTQQKLTQTLINDKQQFNQTLYAFLSSSPTQTPKLNLNRLSPQIINHIINLSQHIDFDIQDMSVQLDSRNFPQLNIIFNQLPSA